MIFFCEYPGLKDRFTYLFIYLSSHRQLLELSYHLASQCQSLGDLIIKEILASLLIGKRTEEFAHFFFVLFC